MRSNRPDAAAQAQATDGMVGKGYCDRHGFEHRVMIIVLRRR